MQYSQDFKEHLAAKKQIATACADEVAMGAIHVDPQILEEHFAVEATIDASHTDVAMWETMGSTKVYNRGPALRGFDPLFDPFCIWVNELSMNISQVKKLEKIVRIKKLAAKHNKIFVCTMKKTSMDHMMAFSKQFTDDYLSNHLYGQEMRKEFIQHPRYNIEVFLKRTKDGRSIIHMHWPKVANTFNINEGSIFAFRLSSFPSEIHLSIYRL
ncbi:Casein kinase I isoform delta-like protein [Hordeum vulgare]|nr:Casein kinase I isoform delta-like protein [Hordeum vulgare]KAE8810114.1 Casein kinase I isoform delta-like protein [Hordeum vulgare]